MQRLDVWSQHVASGATDGCVRRSTTGLKDGQHPTPMRLQLFHPALRPYHPLGALLWPRGIEPSPPQPRLATTFICLPRRSRLLGSRREAVGQAPGGARPPAQLPPQRDKPGLGGAGDRKRRPAAWQRPRCLG